MPYHDSLPRTAVLSAWHQYMATMYFPTLRANRIYRAVMSLHSAVLSASMLNTIFSERKNNSVAHLFPLA